MYTQEKGSQFVAENVGEQINTLIEYAFVSQIMSGDEKGQTLLNSEDFRNTYDEENDEFAEPLEYWIVSNWFARILDEYGEVISLKDDNKLNLNIWGRCQSGQRVAVDAIIEEIINDKNY